MTDYNPRAQLSGSSKYSPSLRKRVRISYLKAQVQIITKTHLRVQPELETNLKKRKTIVFTCPAKLTCLTLLVFIFSNF